MHTIVGKAKKRGIEQFREESAKLVPPQLGGKDKYEDEAYRLWTLQTKTGSTSGRRFIRRRLKQGH